MNRPTIVCLTPVRNEEWILERFLRCASLWADLIIIADQSSEDRSSRIASQFPKVRIIQNRNPAYDERARQRLLLDSARQMVPGPRLLLTLDADEALSANFASSAEWASMSAAPPGTVFRFRWMNLRPGCRQGWFSKSTFAWGYMDDGAEHSGSDIHSPRLPIPSDGRQIVCDEIRVLHFQYTDPKRMESKHRWYQCFERVRNPRISTVKLFDQYHHMYRVRPPDLVETRPEWLDAYQKAGIDMTSVNTPEDGIYWWDPLVLELMKKHGAGFFARENIWEDWPRVLRQLGADPLVFGDPRTRFEKKVHRFLMSRASLENRFWARKVKSCLKRIRF